MIDYSICGRWADQVQATFIIESNERPDAEGDGGLAYGPGQMHPVFFVHYYGVGKPFAAEMRDSWATAWLKAAANFFELHEDSGMDLCVQAYQLGWHAVLYDGMRRPERLTRFYDALNSIRSHRSCG